MSQGDLAEAVGVHLQTVAGWEQGRSAPRPWYRPILAEVLQIDLEALDDLLQLDVFPAFGGTTIPVVAHDWGPDEAGALTAALLATGDDRIEPDMAPRLVHEWLVTDPPQAVELHAGRRIGSRLASEVAERVSQLRHLDDFVAGTDLEGAVTREVVATAMLVSQASYTDAVGRQLLTALGDLCQLAGWVAADAGRHAWACHYYATGLAAAHAAGDAALAGQLASTLAYHLANRGRSADAVLLAQSAIAGSKNTASATTRALFLERLAWAHAKQRDPSSADRALGAVEDAYSRRKPEDDPPWTYWLTPGEVEVMAGRCYVELRQPDRGVPALEHAVAEYGEDRPRETALYVSWLAEAHLQAGQVEQAAQLACRVLDLNARTASTRSGDRARHLHQLLRPHHAVAHVQDFAQRFKAATAQG